MDDLIARLRERAEFEDKRVLDGAKALGFVPEVYTGSQTGAFLLEAAAALEAAREDGERLDYVMRHVRGSELRRIGILTNGGDHRPAIDQARGKAGQEVGK